jgi:hypothetical protein
MDIGELKGILQNPESTIVQKKYATEALRVYSETTKRWAAKGESGKHIELLATDNADGIWRGFYTSKKKIENGVESEEVVLASPPDSDAPGFMFVSSRPSNIVDLSTKTKASYE